MCHAEISAPTLLLTITEETLYYFYPLLQQGVMIKIQVGSSIKAMLCDKLGISPDYIEEQIKTIFLDGKPVDDLASAMIKDGSVVALSAAMPGLVGATFRRGGHLALFRSTITHQKEKVQAIQGQEGFITLKLFNLLIRELGPKVLKQGIWIKGDDLENFFKTLPENIWAGCKEVRLNNRMTEMNSLPGKNLFDRHERVLVFVKN